MKETLFGSEPSKPERKPRHTPAPTEPIPNALYISNGLAFGLFNGGQQSDPTPIKWTRLAPIQKVSA